jgi:hypothetical protein
MAPDFGNRVLAAILSAEVVGNCWIALRRFRVAS